MFNDLDVVTYG